MNKIIIRIALATIGAVGALTLIYIMLVFPRAPYKAFGNEQITIVEDRQIQYFTAGEGPRVVLLASLGRSVSDFNELVPRLNAAGFRTIAVESRGVGGSTLGAEGIPELYDLGDDIAAALTADGTSTDEQVFVIGHAFGNRVARAFAHSRPERVKGIALLASGGAQKLRDMPEAREALIGSFKWWNLPPVRQADIRYAFFAEDQPIPSSWKRGWHIDAMRAQATAVANTPEREWRDAGGVAPILVVQGIDDRIAPAHVTSAKLQAEYPDRITVHAIANAGHALLPEAPDEIAEQVITFLQGLEYQTD